jgi:hypothetical protein
MLVAVAVVMVAAAGLVVQVGLVVAVTVEKAQHLVALILAAVVVEEYSTAEMQRLEVLVFAY